MIIFLTILKVIAYILLAIIGILIALILLVLFVPIRYSISGNFSVDLNWEEFIKAPGDLKIRVSWLLKLLRAYYHYPDSPFLRVKLLYFTIYDSRVPPEEVEEIKEKVKNEVAELADEVVEEVTGELKEVVGKEESEEGAENPDAKVDVSSLDGETEDGSDELSPDEIAGLSFFAKIKHFFQKTVYTIKKFYARMVSTRLRIEDFFKKINDISEKLKSEEVKQALALCLTHLKRIWKNIRPRKIRADLLVGLDDPQKTARFLEVYSILYPYIGENVFIKPDFNRFVIDGEFVVRGRITPYVILWAAWKLYFDQNIRAVIKMFKD